MFDSIVHRYDPQVGLRPPLGREVQGKSQISPNRAEVPSGRAWRSRVCHEAILVHLANGGPAVYFFHGDWGNSTPGIRAKL